MSSANGIPCRKLALTLVDRPQAASLLVLKTLQEAITPSVALPFVVCYSRQPLNLDDLWAALGMLECPHHRAVPPRCRLHSAGSVAAVRGCVVRTVLERLVLNLSDRAAN